MRGALPDDIKRLDEIYHASNELIAASAEAIRLLVVGFVGKEDLTVDYLRSYHTRHELNLRLSSLFMGVFPHLF